jgi:Leucine-rich repeat (LRR) protein
LENFLLFSPHKQPHTIFYKIFALKLENSELKALPEEIGDLTHLKILRLGYNQIQSLPKEIGKLQELTHLFLIGNRIQQLPQEIGELKNLEVLDVRVNPITNIEEIKALLPTCSYFF